MTPAALFFLFLLNQVNQRNVPGIDNAYLAMDTEEGVEVVWNEVMFSERKNFKLQEVGAILYTTVRMLPARGHHACSEVVFKDCFFKCCCVLFTVTVCHFPL